MTPAIGSRWLTGATTRRAARLGTVAAAGALTFALAACGGSSHPAAASASTSTTSASSSAASRTTGPVHAVLVGQTHRPVVNKNWTYTVTATDAHGHPLSGTVETEFTFQGTVVGKETPPTHSLKHGRLKDVLKFPPDAAGQPISVRVVVRTHPGSVTLNWPVTVQK